MNARQIFLVLTLALIAPSPKADAASNFHGSIGLGPFFIYSSDNLSPSGSKPTLLSLADSPDKELTTVPALLPDLHYSPESNSDLDYYFTTHPVITDTGGLTLNTGVAYSGYSFGQVVGGIFYIPLLDAYKDPYLIGTTREETDISSAGAYLGLKKIRGSGLAMQLLYLFEDVEDDLIGRRFTTLARDGDVYGFAVSYALPPVAGAFFTPRIGAIKGEYDGESQSYMRYKAGLGMRYRQGKVTYMPSIGIDHTEYDQTHPIFNSTRDEDHYSARLVIDYASPFGYEKWSLQGTLGYSHTASKIDFFDGESVIGGISAVYQF